MTILSQKLVDALMRRPDFFERMPEFVQLKPGAEKLSRPGCRSCSKRRLQQNLVGAFMTVLLSLPQTGLARLKAYAGVDSLQCQWFNRVTGKYEIKVI